MLIYFVISIVHIIIIIVTQKKIKNIGMAILGLFFGISIAYGIFNYIEFQKRKEFNTNHPIDVFTR